MSPIPVPWAQLNSSLFKLLLSQLKHFSYHHFNGSNHYYYPRTLTPLSSPGLKAYPPKHRCYPQDIITYLSLQRSIHILSAVYQAVHIFNSRWQDRSSPHGPHAGISIHCQQSFDTPRSLRCSCQRALTARIQQLTFTLQEALVQNCFQVCFPRIYNWIKIELIWSTLYLDDLPVLVRGLNLLPLQLQLVQPHLRPGHLHAPPQCITVVWALVILPGSI